MKIRCLKIINHTTQAYELTSPWLTLGKEYIVLEVECSIHKGIEYRIIHDEEKGWEGNSSIHQGFQFEIISTLVPSNWKVHIYENSVSIGPKAWQSQNFWDAYYDGDPKAIEIYNREVKIIYEDEKNSKEHHYDK